MNAALLKKFKKSTYEATSSKLLLLVLISSRSLILSAFFHIDAVLACSGWARRFVVCLPAAVKRIFGNAQAVLIAMYDSNGLNIQKGWKRESQHFRILQPNGCKIWKCWDSRFPVEILLIPLFGGLKIGKSWNRRSQLFPISQPFLFEMAEISKRAQILKIFPTNSRDLTHHKAQKMEYCCLLYYGYHNNISSI